MSKWLGTHYLDSSTRSNDKDVSCSGKGGAPGRFGFGLKEEWNDVPRIRKGIDAFEPKAVFVMRKTRGDCTAIRSWEEFSVEEQQELLTQLPLKEKEKPIIGVKDAVHPLIISSNRMLWRFTDDLSEVALSDIREVDSPEFSKKSKHDLTELQVITYHGKKLSLRTPPKTHFPLWNMLMAFFNNHPADRRRIKSKHERN